MELIQKDEVYRIVGAAMKVHSELGSGFLESVYQEALALEFNSAKIPFEKEKELEIFYSGRKLTKKFYADFICFGSIIVELKAISELRQEHIAQVMNYLKATKTRVGVLINFGERSLKYKRVIC
ncbi:MAG: GxxExxY protein [Treponema sp.]|uniref:GxxExxY protein n=1 Tax=Treponema sp. TaxID=166 RepID=UPI0025F61128|nr:GxxExxY protein [Treponema sp.]MBQ8679358.1 GxxExxY protein [Treponema sp.]MBR4600284.1 GxxExxY protein [Treponema sp.]